MFICSLYNGIHCDSSPWCSCSWVMEFYFAFDISKPAPKVSVLAPWFLLISLHKYRRLCFSVSLHYLICCLSLHMWHLQTMVHGWSWSWSVFVCKALIYDTYQFLFHYLSVIMLGMFFFTCFSCLVRFFLITIWMLFLQDLFSNSINFAVTSPLCKGSSSMFFFSFRGEGS